MTTETITPSTTLTEKIHSWCIGKLPELFAFCGYVALLVYAIPTHEPWADEAHAWQLARSVSLHDLFGRHLRYEGSPGLWHLLLAGLSSLHVNYAGMHWASGIIATIGVALLIFLSPLPRYIKLSLPFTFFLAFQYAVIARSYVLAPLLLFSVAVVWKKSPIYIAILLGLLGNVAMHALAISGGFALVYLIDLKKKRLPAENRRDLLIAASILTILYLVAVVSALPHPADLSFMIPFVKHPSMGWRIFIWVLFSIASLCKGVSSPGYLALIFWPLLIVVFRRARSVYYLLPIGTYALFSGYYFNFWHSGLVIPATLTLMWIAWPRLKEHMTWKPLMLCAACFIVMQIGWTGYAVRLHPYSPGLESARFLAPRVAAGNTIALTYVDHDEVGAYHSIATAPYFDHPIFLNQQSSFWRWSTHENTTKQLLDALDTHPPIVMVVFFSSFEKFNPAKHLKGIRVEYLQQHGYRMTHTFCGEKPEGFGWREETCDLIFEPESTPR